MEGDPLTLECNCSGTFAQSRATLALVLSLQWAATIWKSTGYETTKRFRKIQISDENATAIRSNWSSLKCKTTHAPFQNTSISLPSRFPEDSGVFSALLKNQAAPNPRLSSCSVIIQGTLTARLPFDLTPFSPFAARDEEPLDPCFGQFPHSISMEEGGSTKFTCQLTGTKPMTGEQRVHTRPLSLYVL